MKAEIFDREEVRRRLVEELSNRKRSNPGYRVIDVGGRHNPWADSVVDAYADIFEFETDKTLYVGDINDVGVWEEIEADGPFDFAICSHVLEDIRDPITGLRWLPQVAKAGFIGLPNKHTEFSNQVSRYWLGQSHHNWIFTVQGEGTSRRLLALPKWACIEYFNSAKGVPAEPPSDGQRTEEDLGSRELGWLNPALAGRENELAVRWEGQLPFESPEYTLSVDEQLAMYRDVLAEGL